MAIRIALAGNPNCGKTTLFNLLTGTHQYVGNWPGVTVEKKEGKLKKHTDVKVTDLPGIYSLSPYTPEEVVARNYLIEEKPEVILNIIDGSHLERNLYLTTQLLELGIPVVAAVNMMDVVRKSGDRIKTAELSKALGCPVVEISALKNEGVDNAIEECLKAAEGTAPVPQHTFSGPVEHAIAHIEEAILHDKPEEQQRWFAIKLFERDEKIIEKLGISDEKLKHIEEDIKKAEAEMEDDAESIVTNERYEYIGTLMKKCYHKKNSKAMTVSDKIDRIVTNRILALPIFVIVMFLVYAVVMMPVPMPWGDSLGTVLTDWANDGVFGDGWYLFGIGRSDYDSAMDEYAEKAIWTDEFKADIDKAVKADVLGAEDIAAAIEDGSFADFDEAYETYSASLEEYFTENKIEYSFTDIYDAAMEDEEEEEEAEEDASTAAEAEENKEEAKPAVAEEKLEKPANENYGVWIKGIPALLEPAFENAPSWLHGLVFDGIIGGVGAVLGFVPQMLLLFLFLALLEGCGYMARIAFVLDRVFRRFGLSGKSFIPMLVGSGCGVPGIMASRTIESQRDRRMTIMTTTFIPCGAKMPIIALLTAALFGGAWWVAPSAYFLGVAAIIISGIMLKKTKMFAGDPAPFVMELPAYHWPTFGSVLRSMWERGWSFIKKAGTIILISSVLIWLGNSFGWNEGSFGYFEEFTGDGVSVITKIGESICWIFAPLGFGESTATVATIMGLVAKEEVVGVFGVLDFEGLTPLAGYSFLAFNLLCAPCFAAIGAIKREMNSAKWTLFAVGYQCIFAYATALMIYQFGLLFSGGVQAAGLIAAVLILGFICYMLFRPAPKAHKLKAVKS